MMEGRGEEAMGRNRSFCPPFIQFRGGWHELRQCRTQQCSCDSNIFDRACQPGLRWNQNIYAKSGLRDRAKPNAYGFRDATTN